MFAPEIEVLWWEGCPSTERALTELREALGDVGLEGAEIRMREIQTDADAPAGFKGSPTILIDGTDALEIAASPTETDTADTADTAEAAEAAASPAETESAAAAETPAALTCRVYRRRDGRISPTPDPEDLRDALRLATRAGANR